MVSAGYFDHQRVLLIYTIVTECNYPRSVSQQSHSDWSVVLMFIESQVFLAEKQKNLKV